MQFREMLDQIKSAIKWFISPSEHPVYDGVYCKLIELEDRLRVLEEENIETTNELYRMENSLDARIDILVNEFKND